MADMKVGWLGKYLVLVEFGLLNSVMHSGALCKTIYKWVVVTGGKGIVLGVILFSINYHNYTGDDPNYSKKMAWNLVNVSQFIF